jgi:hypothetical protein
MSNMHGFGDFKKDEPKKKTNNNYAGGTKR